MGRTPCCDQKGLKKGPWTPEEDEKIVEYIKKHGHGSWRSLPNLAGLLRCGKSRRLRWTNYLRPDIKRGPFSPEEEKLVIQLHGILGNRWAAIASQLPGRTVNEIKNLWNIHLKKRLFSMGIDLLTHEPSNGMLRRPPTSTSACHMAQWESARLEAEARLSRESQLLVPSSAGRSETDYFLRIWNSEIGEAFRKFKNGDKCQSPASQISSSTKYGSASGITTEMDLTLAEDTECKDSQPYIEDILQGSDTSSSSELEDSSESALQLLLDFPSNNDMSFLGFLSDSSLNCSLAEHRVGSLNMVVVKAYIVENLFFSRSDEARGVALTVSNPTSNREVVSSSFPMTKVGRMPGIYLETASLPKGRGKVCVHTIELSHIGGI